MKLKNYLCLAAVAVVIGGCTDPKVKAVDEYCLGLENVTDKEARNNQYMQCRKVCQEAELYNMPDGDKKDEITKKCLDANKVGSTQFKKSPERNWLGVMP
jgi:hypothetical protein